MTTNEFITEIKLLKAEIQKGLKREIMFSDIVHRHILAMRAAVVAGHLEGLDHGMQWIFNTLAGPGHLPNLDEARALGGAQAMFDAELREHEEFRAANPVPEPAIPYSKAAVDVLAERLRQVEVEGWTPEHDDEHGRGDLICAAYCYAKYANWPAFKDTPPIDWPWDARSWKPGDARRNLVKAGALILAEIERLDRAEAAKNNDRPLGD